MVNMSSIYSNHRIAPGFYFAKILDISTKDVGADRPLIWTHLEIGPFYKHLGKHTALSSILHPTDNAAKMYHNFLGTFGLEGEDPDYEKALFRWCSIQVYDARYGTSHYSAVRYCYQPIPVLLKTAEITELDEAEKITWGSYMDIL
jgi:hypothetical protein